MGSDLSISNRLLDAPAKLRSAVLFTFFDFQFFSKAPTSLFFLRCLSISRICRKSANSYYIVFVVRAELSPSLFSITCFAKSQHWDNRLLVVYYSFMALFFTSPKRYADAKYMIAGHRSSNGGTAACAHMLYVLYARIYYSFLLGWWCNSFFLVSTWSASLSLDGLICYRDL